MAAGGSRQDVTPMITATAAAAAAMSSNRIEPPPPVDVELSFGERAFSAAGAAVLSAVIVNPLDVAKTRLQAQAAGVPYQGSCESKVSCPNANPVRHLLYLVEKEGREFGWMVVEICTLVFLCLFGEVVVLLRCHYVFSLFKTQTVCCPGRLRAQNRLALPIVVDTGEPWMSSTGSFVSGEFVQEGFGRLWRGTNASLALAVPTVGIYMPCYDIFRNSMEEFTTHNFPALTPYVPLLAGSVSRSLACTACYPVELARTRMQTFTEAHNGMKRPGVWKTLAEVVSPVKSLNNVIYAKSYRNLWSGLGAQLARDVPFSAICWATLEPIRRRVLSLMVDEPGFGSILWANFSAGVVAGSLAAAVTCPLDVAKTRRQIEMDPTRALKMTTRQTLAEIWRDGGMKALFTGVGPRVGRAGPSVGIVVSFYEVVKYGLNRTRHQN